MASETAPTNSHQTEAWTEQQLETVLAHLERMREQVDSLRSTIPDLVKPLKHPQQSKASALLGVRNAAARKTEDLRAFDVAWRGGETQRVLERARESYARDGDLTRRGEVAEWGWIERDEGRNGKRDGY